MTERQRPLRRGAQAIRDPEHRYLDRFGPVLTLSVITIGGLNLVDLYGADVDQNSVVPATLLGVTVALTLMLALRASGAARRTRRFANAFLLFTISFSLIVMVLELVTDVDVEAVSTRRPSPVWVVIAMSTPVLVIRRLVQHRRVTRQTMFGAIAAYLMIAIGYSYLFLYVAELNPDPFFAGTDDQTSSSFAYFSLTTITTLGYGDLSPTTKFGRLLATSEAIVGQVYLVTFVAMFVGLYIAQRPAADPDLPATEQVLGDTDDQDDADPIG